MITVACILALVAISPIALRQLGLIRGINWVNLSYIGQTYGAASALLTALALIGVIVSLILQARATEASQVQSSREHHLHLLEMAITDPSLLPCWAGWGVDPANYPTPARWRRFLYVNLIISYSARDYTIGNGSDHWLQVELARLFQGEPARQYWEIARKIRLESADNASARRFCELVDNEYQKARDAGPPAVLADVPPPHPPTGLSDKAVVAATTLVLAGVGSALFKWISNNARTRGIDS